MQWLGYTLIFHPWIFHLLKGEKIDSNDLRNILQDMGIELTDKEHKQLLKTLPIDGKSCKCHQAFQGTWLSGSVWVVLNLLIVLFSLKMPYGNRKPHLTCKEILSLPLQTQFESHHYVAI